MKKFLSSNPERLDPLGGTPRISPESALKIGQFIENSQDPFADLVVRSSKRVVEQAPRVKKPAVRKDKSTPITPGLAY